MRSYSAYCIAPCDGFNDFGLAIGKFEVRLKKGTLFSSFICIGDGSDSGFLGRAIALRTSVGKHELDAAGL